MSDTLFESWDLGVELGQLVNSIDDRACMTFTPSTSHRLTSVKFQVWRDTGDTPGLITLRLQLADGNDKPDGVDLATAVIDGDTILEGAPGSLQEWVFSTPRVLLSGTRYALVIEALDSSAGEPVTVGYNVNDTPHYSGGEYGTSADSGVAWTMQANVEFIFYEYGIEVVDPPAQDSASSGTWGW